MGTYRLNLSALRRKSHSRAQSSTQGPLTMSRREMLGLTGAAAIGLSPVAKAVESSLLGAFQCDVVRGRVSFSLGGVDRWIIDVRRFAGSPDLRVDKTDELISMELTNARYPGTDLPADMACRIERGLTGWQMKLRMKLGGFRASVPFERWLLGRETAESTVTIDHRLCALDDNNGLRLQGKADAVFRPDGSLWLSGKEIARLDIDGKHISSDSISISMPKSGGTSLVTKPAPKRSLVVLRRENAPWDADLFLADTPSDWLVSTGACAFDTISFELGEHKTGLPQRTLLAESLGNGTRLRACTTSLGDTDDFNLALGDVRYTTTFGKTENQSALLAGYSEPAWLDLGSCSVELGDSPETPDFEVSRIGQKQHQVTCLPALLALVAPLIGANTAPAKPRRPINIDLSGRKTLPPVRKIPTTPPAAENPPATTRPPTTKPPVKVQPDIGRIVKPIKEKPPVIVIPMNFTVSVVRPSDLLCLEFEFVNLKYSNGTPPSLERIDPKSSSYVIVRFPPQNIAERAFFETAPSSPDNEPVTPAPIPSMLSGPSRLVYRLPSKTSSVPYTLKSLLDWRQFEPSLVPVALPPPGEFVNRVGSMTTATSALERTFVIAKPSAKPAANLRRPGAIGMMSGPALNANFAAANSELLANVAKSLLSIQPPTETQTAIEAPYRLIVSPHANEAWAHSTPEVTHGGRTELWHTRLGVKNGSTIYEGDTPFKTVRPIWSPDYDPKNPPSYADVKPFRMSLCKRDRCEIVGLSSNYQASGYDPLPAQAKRLMLTSLGAWMDTRALWNPKKLMYNTSEWRQISTMGRDHYVKVVAIGYLFPFGHLAVRTTITERKFEQAGKKIGAYNKQVVFITVLKPIVEYPTLGGDAVVNNLPFKRVECVTTVTPNLGKPESSAVPGTNAEAFWPVYGTEAYKFQFIGEDWDGKHSEFDMPVIFTMFSTAFDTTKLGKVRNEYAAEANAERRKADFKGQKVAYAESSEPGDTTCETYDFSFDGNTMNFSNIASILEQMKEEDQPPFYPTLNNADVSLPHLRHLVGKQSKVNISYSIGYKTGGFGVSQNKGEVWAKIKDPISLQFGGSPDKSCGVASPDMSIGGISRAFGPVGGAADKLASGGFDPKTFFGDAKILGGVSLADILDEIVDFGSLTSVGSQIPILKSIPIYDGDKSMPSAIETRLDWQTSRISDDKVTETFLASANGKHSSLALSMVKRTALDGGESTSAISGHLSNFTIQLVPKIMHLIDVEFNYLHFTCEDGKKPDVKADIDKIRFRGCLEFINPLEEFIGGDGFSDPPYLDITSQHIRAGFTQAIPTIAVGVFSLQNISLDAGLKIPFIGDPVSMKFLFCEKQNPFLMTVSIFGGGGYFGLEIDPKGVKTVEGSLEFGGCFALSLGVASGGVHLMAGVAFMHNSTTTKLSGYLRCGGAIEVLGMITVSLEFIMSLDYYSNPSRLYGVATLTVEVEVLFFSASVDLTVEREFGGGGDPGFADTMTEGDWESYCDAFAA